MSTKDEILSARLKAFLLLLPYTLVAQQDHVPEVINGSPTVLLNGYLHPLARSANDQGPVGQSMDIPGMMLVLKRTDAQEADFQRLLDEQQDPGSANYHKWLTPESFADRFGVSQGDMSRIVAWLRSQNFVIRNEARSRNFVFFRGTAEQVKKTFNTEIHHYIVGNDQHYAADREPTIPVALEGVVFGIRGMDDFYPKSSIWLPKTPSGWGLVPGDIRVIYDIPYLHSTTATLNQDGAGQRVVIVGQWPLSAAEISGDITTYYHTYNQNGVAPNVGSFLNPTSSLKVDPTPVLARQKISWRPT